MSDKDKQEPKKEDKKEEKKGEKKEEKKDEKKADEKDDKIVKKPEAIAKSAATLAVKTVVVHPLVLLSVVDHAVRTIQGDTSRRVVGILLGELSKDGRLDISNSYAVPFEEDAKDPKVLFLDLQYHEEMFAMFKKVNAKEKVVGWYSTARKIKPNDLDINESVRRYCTNPIMVCIDVDPQDDLEIPTTAYCAVENAPEEKSKDRMTFIHLPCEIGAYEAEEVGVEHLLRNITDSAIGSVADQVKAKLSSLKGLKKRLEEMNRYLDDVIQGAIAPNHKILYNIQNMFNLVPDLKVKELVKAFAISTNDQMLVIYISALVRAIIALHTLINNKLNNRALESEALKPKEEPKEKKDEETEADKEKEKEKDKENSKEKEQDKTKEKEKDKG